MKKKYSYKKGKKTIEQEYNYIPFRYILAITFTVLEIIAIISVVVLLCYYVPYFYIAAMITEFFCVINIISSDDNPDYKAPWLLFVLILPVAGFMLYFLFYSRKLKNKFIKRLGELKRYDYEKDDSAELAELYRLEPIAASHANQLIRIAGTHLFKGTSQTYFPSGEDMLASMLTDLEAAKSFIFLEYFIIEEGRFWNQILDILKTKVSKGVTVRVIYDDIGCMGTLPGNYAKQLKKFGIDAMPFSRLKGNADSEFNNRNHRKILVIDGMIGYTGGVNIADEYINEHERFGHWKDTGIRLCGEAVLELTRLFLQDYGMGAKKLPEDELTLYPKADRQQGQAAVPNESNLQSAIDAGNENDVQPAADTNYAKNASTENGVQAASAGGFIIPFGDGPRPLYTHSVGKSVIENMLDAAIHYAYITTPYLIIDNDLCSGIEGAALRGVDVKIILPHIPDKRIVFTISRSYYKRLIDAGVKIYEYEPGFIHAKNYIADDKYAMIGTINLDYRSLAHHFENGVWMYKTDCISAMKADFDETLKKCIEITPSMIKVGALTKLFRSIVRIFAPML